MIKPNTKSGTNMLIPISVTIILNPQNHMAERM